MDWKEIEEVVSEAAESGDPILSRVRDLRLDINHFSMLLWDPFEQEFDSNDEDDENEANKPVLVQLDLDLSAQVGPACFNIFLQIGEQTCFTMLCCYRS